MSIAQARAFAWYVSRSIDRRWKSHLVWAFALFLLAFSSASVFFFFSALEESESSLLDHQPTLVLSGLQGGRPTTLPSSLVNALRAEPSIRSLEPRIHGYVALESLASNLVVTTAVPRANLDLSLALQGHAPNEPGEAVLGFGVAQALGLRLGDQLALAEGLGTTANSLPPNERPIPRTKLLRVVGVFAEEGSLLSSDLLWATESDARALLGMPQNEYTDLAIDVDPPSERSVIEMHAREVFPSLLATHREDLQREMGLSFDYRGGYFSMAMIPALVAFLILLLHVARVSSDREQAEIRVLSLLGFAPEILLLFRLAEFFVVAFATLALALAMAALFVFVLRAPGLFETLVGNSTLLVRPSLISAWTFQQYLLLSFGLAAPIAASASFPLLLQLRRDPREIA